MWRRLTALVAVALVAAACAPTDDPPSATPGTTVAKGTADDAKTDPPGEQPHQIADATDEAVGDPDATNLADFFGWDEGTDIASARMREHEMRREELLAACMAKEGFTYQPRVYTDDDYVGLFDTGVDRAARVGYGVVAGFITPDKPRVDPNLEHLTTVSRAEEQAWWDALWGSDPDRSEAEETHRNAGCIGEMEAELNQPFDASGWASLAADLDALHEAILSDGRVIEAERSWTTCMVEAGHDATTIEAWERMITERFSDRVQSLLGTVGLEPDPDEVARIAREEGRAAANRFHNAFVAEALAPLADEMRALQEQEIEIAVVDHECRESYAEAYRAAQLEAEERFIVDHREALTAIAESQR